MARNRAEQAVAPAGSRVGDLRKLVGDGGEPLFKHTVEPTGEEPVFYRVATRREVEHAPKTLVVMS